MEFLLSEVSKTPSLGAAGAAPGDAGEQVLGVGGGGAGLRVRPAAPGGGPGATMGCSDSRAGALLEGGVAGSAAVAFSHDPGS